MLAIGVYGIGEMLWTIEQARGEVKTTTPKMTLKGMAADTKGSGVERLEGNRHRVVSRVLRRRAAGGRGHAGLAHGLRRRER